MDCMEDTWKLMNYFGNSNVELSKMEETTNATHIAHEEEQVALQK